MLRNNPRRCRGAFALGNMIARHLFLSRRFGGGADSFLGWPIVLRALTALPWTQSLRSAFAPEAARSNMNSPWSCRGALMLLSLPQDHRTSSSTTTTLCLGVIPPASPKEGRLDYQRRPKELKQSTAVAN